MADARIAHLDSPKLNRLDAKLDAVISYPFPELVPPRKALDAECDGLVADVARVIAETGATLDALMAVAEQQFQRLRNAHTVIGDLDDEQAAAVLRAVREGGAP